MFIFRSIAILLLTSIRSINPERVMTSYHIQYIRKAIVHNNGMPVALAPQIVRKYQKCGSSRRMLMRLLMVPRWIRTVPFVNKLVIGNGPILGLSILR